MSRKEKILDLIEKILGIAFKNSNPDPLPEDWIENIFEDIRKRQNQEKELENKSFKFEISQENIKPTDNSANQYRHYIKFVIIMLFCALAIYIFKAILPKEFILMLINFPDEALIRIIIGH